MRSTKKQFRALKQANYDLFNFPDNSPEMLMNHESTWATEASDSHYLPAESELYEMYNNLNNRLFQNRLPDVTINYSDRMLTAGSFMPVTNEIKIGRKYHLIYPDDIEDTLAHEMIHILYPNHGPEFKKLAGHLGISLKAKDHPALRTYCRYIYFCPNCGKEYPRRKRLRMASCGICTKGRNFDPKFKLKLKKDKKKSG